jgi:hypothetical protein
MAAGQLIFVEAVEISQISTATGGTIGGVVDDGHSAPPRRRDAQPALHPDQVEAAHPGGRAGKAEHKAVGARSAIGNLIYQ